MRSYLWSGLIGFVLLCLLGCGGGEGGDLASYTVTYRTRWAGPALSQYITVTNANGDTVATQVINNPITLMQSRDQESVYTFPSLPSGRYTVNATLYSEVDANGTDAGAITLAVSLDRARVITANTGGIIAGITVTRPEISITPGAVVPFSAAATDAAGAYLFTQPTDFSWTALGGVGTVSTSGQFSATSVGTGLVRATYTPNGLQGSSSVTVTAPNVQRSKWTVLVYLNAANDLFTYSDPNVNQMEKVAANPDVRFVVQWKQSKSNFAASSFDGTRRYLVRPDTTTQINSTLLQDLGQTVDMGLPQTLNDFIKWGQANYPADRYCLVVWNHGSGWNRSANNIGRAVSFDDQTGNTIHTWELDQALAGVKLDVLAFDASLMQMMEVAYEVRNNFDYVAGSEESPPGEGYPYDAVFSPFVANPSAPTVNLVKGFVDGMINDPRYTNRKITQSVIDTSKLPAAASALSIWATEMTVNNAALQAAIPAARTASQAYSPSTVRYYHDIIDFATRLQAQPNVPTSVSTAAANAVTAVRSAIVWEAHNTKSANSNGLAIDLTPGMRFNSYAPDYAKMKFGIDTQWDEWLKIAP